MRCLTRFLFLALALAIVPTAAFAQGRAPYLADRGTGIPTSMFGDYVRAGEFNVYPFYEYTSGNPEYKPAELGFGLDQDFRGIPFGPMPRLMALADQVTKLTAICVVCGEPATRTQRLIDGQPAPADSPLIVIGGLGDEKYEARCRLHHEVPAAG